MLRSRNIFDLMDELDRLDGREVHITQHVTRIERTGDGVMLGSGGQSLRDLARAVSRELARLEDEEGGL